MSQKRTIKTPLKGGANPLGLATVRYCFRTVRTSKQARLRGKIFWFLSRVVLAWMSLLCEKNILLSQDPSPWHPTPVGF